MNQKSFYQYIILAACFLLMAFPFSIINSIHSLFITPVTREFGFSKTSFSFLFTISALTVAICSPIIGKLLNKFSLRIVMSVCSVLAGGGFLSYSFCSKITSFYLIAILVSIGMTGLTTIPVSLMLTRWFPKKKGTALGIAFAGIGFGSLFFMQIVSRLIQSKGYAFAYLLLGGLILLVTLPISLCVVRLPESEESEYITTKAKNNHKKSLPVNKIFLCFLVALFFLGMTTSGIKVHVQPYLDVVGYSTIHNANVGSLQALVSVISNLIAGKFFDKLGIRRAVLFYGTMNVLSVLCLVLVRIPVVPFLYSIFFGFALSLPGLLPSYGVTTIFPNHEYATTLGVANSIFTIGSSFGPTVTGVFADHFLGYTGAWIFYGGLAVCYMFLLLSMLRLTTARDDSML